MFCVDVVYVKIVNMENVYASSTVNVLIKKEFDNFTRTNNANKNKDADRKQQELNQVTSQPYNPTSAVSTKEVASSFKKNSREAMFWNVTWPMLSKTGWTKVRSNETQNMDSTMMFCVNILAS